MYYKNIIIIKDGEYLLKKDKAIIYNLRKMIYEYISFIILRKLIYEYINIKRYIHTYYIVDE